jgi:ketosteroid isomerase-like protein
VAHDNVELVRRFYDAINAIGSFGSEFVDPEHAAPELWERVAPDFELHMRSDLPDAEVFRGREESKGFWRRVQELFVEMHWEPAGFVDRGDVVLVEGRVVARGRGSEIRIEADETNVFWFRDGELVRVQGYPTKDEALAALS